LREYDDDRNGCLWTTLILSAIVIVFMLSVLKGYWNFLFWR